MVHACNRDKCPTANINGPKMNCIECDKQIFVKCYGRCSDDGFFTFELPAGAIVVETQCLKQIKIKCATCQLANNNVNARPVSSTNTSEQSSSLSNPIPTPIRHKDAPKQSRQLPITGCLPSDKIDKIYDMISDVRRTVDRVVDNVIVHRTESKEYSQTIEEKINQATALIKSSATHSSSAINVNPLSYSSVVGSSNINSNSSFPSLATPNRLKRRRIEGASARPQGTPQTATPKSTLKGRTTLSGTSTDHGLTAPIKKTLSSRKVSPTSHLVRSLYLRNFATSVTVGTISELIKNKLPGISDNEFNVRILVKKDQPLDELSFVSFRLMCTEDLYPKCSDPSMWPHFAEIGEWLEQPREKRRLTTKASTPQSSNQTNVQQTATSNSNTVGSIAAVSPADTAGVLSAASTTDELILNLSMTKNSSHDMDFEQLTDTTTSHQGLLSPIAPEKPHLVKFDVPPAHSH